MPKSIREDPARQTASAAAVSAAAEGAGAVGAATGRIAARVDAAPALELDRRPARILSFGSQLVHGSVGLNAAERVTTASGIRVVAVPTILLSAMPHYESVHHIEIPAHWLAQTLHDLDQIRALASVEIVTSGYLASPSQTEPIARWYDALPRASRPPLLLDPTLGDTELGFYTDPEVAGAIRRDLVPLATGITPNLFELAHLTGIPLPELTTPARIEAAARTLMGPRTEWVAVTGVDCSPHPNADAVDPLTTDTHAPDTQTPDAVGELLVTRMHTTVHTHARVRTSAKGLGDTFAAALAVAVLGGADITAAVDAAATAVRSAVHPYIWSPACP